MKDNSYVKEREKKKRRNETFEKDSSSSWDELISIYIILTHIKKVD